MIVRKSGSDDVGTTKRREVVFENLADVVDECRRLTVVGYHHVGQWNLGQICQHLAAGMNQSVDGFEDPPPFWMPIAKPLIRMLVLPTILKGGVIKMKATAPKSTLPSANADDEIRLAELEEAIARISDENVEFVESPIFGKLTTDQWRKFHLWHCQHHMSFLIPANKR
ncbi:DUF1569 domain-containing protein [Blastopirellula marina]|uniref:DUF1569 domain-containing protein n=1 Tax=Blastopirellula marina DSM 3645 TaxID=314230 RepID=A3ZTI2_9BACT|nr:DUF1569 domain-containing protein [Blastopirellula marina]EAQ80243.1 hypothetical protein DSM3645_19643 [Blastopirellula marina DSM 3645]